MSTPKFTGLSTKKVNQILQTQTVRKALNDRAARALPRARAIAYQAGATEFAKQLKVVQGTRPGTAAKAGLQRSYARVQATMTDEQKKRDRAAKITRRQILRRAGSGS